MNSKDMADLKACIECTTTWENKDNKNLTEILQCTLVDSANETSAQPPDYEEATSASNPSSKASLRLRPFLHPEMTESPHCEVRVFVPPRIHKRITKVALKSSARNVEVYDRNGEYQLTAKGEKCEASHRFYTCVFCVKPECFEMVFRFLSLSEESVLRLQLIHLFLAPYTWSGDLPSLGASHSLPAGSLNLERIQELTNFGDNLSPSAKQILSMMEQQQRLQHQSGNSARVLGSNSLPTTLLSTLLASQHLRTPEEKRDSSDSTSSGDIQTGVVGGSSDSTLATLAVTRWLDDRLQAMEARIMARLDTICLRLSAIEEMGTPRSTPSAQTGQLGDD